MKIRIMFFSVIGTIWLTLVGSTNLFVAYAQESIRIPPPTLDLKEISGEQVIVLAGGCFWGVQGVFQHVEGVIKAVSGYAGGEAKTAHYRAVTSGQTDHAESVKITFDSSKISYGKILQIYFSVAHDPTQLNRQGPDIGTHYRSSIFPQNETQAKIAKAYIAQLNSSRLYKAAIVTKIEMGKEFYVAEDYHQDYMIRNPNQPYIVFHDLPKIDSLKRLFPEKFTSKPHLVAQTGT